MEVFSRIQGYTYVCIQNNKGQGALVCIWYEGNAIKIILKSTVYSIASIVSYIVLGWHMYIYSSIIFLVCIRTVTI